MRERASSLIWIAGVDTFRSGSADHLLVGRWNIDDDGFAGHRIKDDNRHRLLLLMISTVGQAGSLLVAIPRHRHSQYVIARELVTVSLYGLGVSVRCRDCHSMSRLASPLSLLLCLAVMQIAFTSVMIWLIS